MVKQKYTVKQGDGLQYSFVTGEGPGEGTMEECKKNLQAVPQKDFLAQIRGAKLATSERVEEVFNDE